MRKIRHPLYPVSQQQALLPDGSLDPERATDCGEACLSSVLVSFGLPDLSPGCVRQSLGREAEAGYTTALDLAAWLGTLGFVTSTEDGDGATLQAHVQAAYASGGCAIALGQWFTAGFNHWNVTGVARVSGVWVMEPELGRELYHDWAAWHALQPAGLVVVHAQP